MAYPSLSAAPRLYTLQNVIMDDGAVVQGSFVYDPVTKAIATWSIAVSGGNTAVFPAFTYGPTTSLAIFHQERGYFLFVSAAVSETYSGRNRSLSLVPATPISDSTSTAVLLNVANSYAGECYNCNPFRKFVSGVIVPATSGSLSHVVSGGSWKTILTLVNNGSSASTATLNIYDDDGKPLALPLSYPQSGAMAPRLQSTVTQTLDAGAVLIVESAGSTSDPLLVGSAQLAPASTVSGFAVFQQRTGFSVQEAVVPLENRGANTYVLAFDNSGGFVTGVALANLSPQPASVPIAVRDEKGGSPILNETITLPGQGHVSFVLSDRFLVTRERRGTIEFRAPDGGSISVLGLRFNPAGSFSTIPALAK
jgi:hypothetical protein